MPDDRTTRDPADAEEPPMEGETVTGTETETDAGDGRVVPEKGDEGKPVAYTSGNEIGEVIDVNDGVAFVDPHPSLAEKVMARLGVDEDEEYYRLPQDRIERITGDEVVITTGEFADEPVEDGS